jgi:hypothetical protein
MVARWADAADKGYFGLSEYAEVASLPDPQLATLFDMAMRGEFPFAYPPQSPARAQLALWNALPVGQRKKALSEGLRYTDLAPDARLKFVLGATDPSARQLAEVKLDEGRLLTTVLKVTMREANYWGVHRKGFSTTARVDRVDSEGQPVSRDEAHRRFRTLDESIKIEEIQPMVRAGVTLSYDCDQGAVAITYIELPTRWGAAGSNGHP